MAVSVSVGDPVTLAPLFARAPGMGVKNMQTGNTSYFHGDQIGSLRAVTDTPAGIPNVTGRVVYTAFGERVWENCTIGTRHQYAGAWGYDTMPEFSSGMSPHFGGEPGDEVPFVHVGHRWYDPASGRFLQRDPIGIWGGFNFHAYVGNNPSASVDPLGLQNPPGWITKEQGASVVAGTGAGALATYGCLVLVGVGTGGVGAVVLIAMGGAAGGVAGNNIWACMSTPTPPPFPPPIGPKVPPGPTTTRTYGQMRPLPVPPPILIPLP